MTATAEDLTVRSDWGTANDTDIARQQAERLAWSAPGVTAVRHRLKIQP